MAENNKFENNKSENNSNKKIESTCQEVNVNPIEGTCIKVRK